MELNSAITEIHLEVNAKLFDQLIAIKMKFDSTISRINLGLNFKLID